MSSRNLISHLGVCGKCSSTTIFRSNVQQCRYYAYNVDRKFYGYPKLTPQQVNARLKANEKSVDLSSHQMDSVRSFDTNQLAANNPIEDRRIEAKCTLTTGLLFAVLDGHGGASCAEVLSQRLLNYVVLAMLPPRILKDLLSLSSEQKLTLLSYYNTDHFTKLPNSLLQVYEHSFRAFLEATAKESPFVVKDQNDRQFVGRALKRAFLHLDGDLSREALSRPTEETQDKSSADSAPTDAKSSAESAPFQVAMSGSVCIVCHVDGAHLTVANTGDCQAVLGTLTDHNTWLAHPLCTEHNIENSSEVQRILGEHPKKESKSILKNGRLLGQLAPLRAFGDFRFKWSKEDIRDLCVPRLGEQALLPNYLTPPYLTAEPEIIHHRLTPRDRFLVLASDGLWEQASRQRVVSLVGEYMSGRQTWDPFRLPKEEITLKEIRDMLKHRKEGLEVKPTDTNAATHLLRNALGGTEYGVEHGMLSKMLGAPDDAARFVRDDITITVIFFDPEFIRNCPA